MGATGGIRQGLVMEQCSIIKLIFLMIALHSPVQGTRKTHKKENSTDSINSQRKRRFLSVVSSESIVSKPTCTRPTPLHLHHQRKISQLKKQAMGEITNRHEGQKASKGVQLKIKRVSANLANQKGEERGVAERMVSFKQRLANLIDLGDSYVSKENATAEGGQESGLQTPINRLLYQSRWD